MSNNRLSASARTEVTDNKSSKASLQHKEIQDQLRSILGLAAALRKTEEVPSWSATSLGSSWSPGVSAAGIQRTSQTTAARGLAESEAGASQTLFLRRTLSIHSEDEFIGAPSREALKILVSAEERVVQASIGYGDSDKLAVVAKIQPEQACNFISAFRASQLGLLDFVQPRGDDDKEIWIMLPSGKVRPDGTVRIRWYPRQSGSFPIQLFVLSGWRNKRLFLGRLLLSKKRITQSKAK